MIAGAIFKKIEKILPHDNDNSLEIAVVSNFPCIVKKSEFKVGDWCFYIRDGAQLIEYNRKKEYENRSKLTSDVFVTCDQYSPVFAWQEPLFKYLDDNGKVSMGIILKPNSVLYPKGFEQITDNEIFFQILNKKILNPECGAEFLERSFGILYFVEPLKNDGNIDIEFKGDFCKPSETDEKI